MGVVLLIEGFLFFAARYKVDQKGSEINMNQKKIGEKKKVSIYLSIHMTLPPLSLLL